MIISSNNALRWYGLRGKIWSETTPLKSNYTYNKFNYIYGNYGSAIFNQITEPTETQQLHTRTKERRKFILFSGVLKDFSDSYIRLALRHYGSDIDSKASRSSNYIGGFDVVARWRGCNFRSGERLQYALVPEDSSSEYHPEFSNTKWPLSAIQQSSLKSFIFR